MSHFPILPSPSSLSVKRAIWGKSLKFSTQMTPAACRVAITTWSCFTNLGFLEIFFPVFRSISAFNSWTTNIYYHSSLASKFWVDYYYAHIQSSNRKDHAIKRPTLFQRWINLLGQHTHISLSENSFYPLFFCLFAHRFPLPFDNPKTPKRTHQAAKITCQPLPLSAPPPPRCGCAGQRCSQHRWWTCVPGWLSGPQNSDSCCKERRDHTGQSQEIYPFIGRGKEGKTL